MPTEGEEWESAPSRMEEEEGEGGAVGAAAPMESVEAGSRSVFRKCSLEEGGAAHASPPSLKRPQPEGKDGPEAEHRAEEG